jgi:hypothetical protein
MSIIIPDSCTFWFNSAILAVIFYIAYAIFKIDRMYKNFPKICNALTRMAEALYLRKITPENYFISESPIRLTEAGKQMLQDSGFPVFFEANKEHLIKLIKAQNPKSPFDVEEASKKIMLELPENTPRFESLKSFAFNNGVPIVKILLAYSIPLRDEAIKELGFQSQNNTPEDTTN